MVCFPSDQWATRGHIVFTLSALPQVFTALFSRKPQMICCIQEYSCLSRLLEGNIFTERHEDKTRLICFSVLASIQSIHNKLVLNCHTSVLQRDHLLTDYFGCDKDV